MKNVFEKLIEICNTRSSDHKTFISELQALELKMQQRLHLAKTKEESAPILQELLKLKEKSTLASGAVAELEDIVNILRNANSQLTQ
jgi:hypothetical protein